MLIENPSSQIAATVPIKATGIAVAGISVVRQSRMNRKITPITTPTAMTRVTKTSRTEPRMNRASSEIFTISTSRSRWFMRAITARSTASEISMVLDWARRTIPRPMTRRPSSRL